MRKDSVPFFLYCVAGAMFVAWATIAFRSLLRDPHAWREAAHFSLLTAIFVVLLLAQYIARGAEGTRSRDSVPTAIHRRLQLSFGLAATGLLIAVFALGYGAVR